MTSGLPTIAWIGTGVMGASMAGHLQRAGYPLRVFTRTRSKAADLEAAGATWCASAAEAAEGADIACLMVGYPEDVESQVLGQDGVLKTLADGGLLIDFTSSRPELAVRIAERAAERGIDALDAPVSGGDVGAREARLSIMVGGTEEAFARARPLLELLGANVVLQGPPGSFDATVTG